MNQVGEYCPYCGTFLMKALSGKWCPNCGLIEEYEEELNNEQKYRKYIG